MARIEAQRLLAVNHEGRAFTLSVHDAVRGEVHIMLPESIARLVAYGLDAARDEWNTQQARGDTE